MTSPAALALGRKIGKRCRNCLDGYQYTDVISAGDHDTERTVCNHCHGTGVDPGALEAIETALEACRKDLLGELLDGLRVDCGGCTSTPVRGEPYCPGHTLAKDPDQ